MNYKNCLQSNLFYVLPFSTYKNNVSLNNYTLSNLPEKVIRQFMQNGNKISITQLLNKGASKTLRGKYIQVNRDEGKMTYKRHFINNFGLVFLKVNCKRENNSQLFTYVHLVKKSDSTDINNYKKLLMKYFYTSFNQLSNETCMSFIKHTENDYNISLDDTVLLRKTSKFSNKILEYNTLLAKNQNNVLATVLDKIRPCIETRSIKSRGRTLQIPVEIHLQRQFTLSVRWLKNSAKNQHKYSSMKAIAEEFRQILKHKETRSVKSRDNLHRIAESHRAFMFLRR